MTRLAVLLLTALLISANACAEEIIISTTDPDSPVKKLQQVFPIYGDVNLLPTTRILYDKPRVVIKIIYPKIESISPDENIDAFNQAVTDATATLAGNFKNEVADLKSVQASMNKSELRNNLTVDFDSATINANEAPIISIRFSAQGYVAGMAHPYHRHSVLNYDLESGQKIELADLFRPDVDYLQILSEYSRTVLARKLADKQQMLQGTEPLPENFKNWNIKPYGLMITFDEYQVAPSAYGPKTVLIPYSAIKGLLAKDTALFDCLKHSKRCFRNRLLTGGFMDEASTVKAVDTRHRVLNPATGKA